MPGCAAQSSQKRNPEKEKAITVMKDIPPDILSLELGIGLIPLVDKDKGAELLDIIQSMRRQIAIDWGIKVPKLRIVDNMLLDPLEYRIKIRGIDVGGKNAGKEGYKIEHAAMFITTHLTGIIKKHAAEFSDSIKDNSQGG